MAKLMRAEIHWKTEEESGRVRPPAGGQPPYMTVVGFPDEPWPPAIAWSLIVDMIPELSSEYRWVAEVRFLVDKAPTEKLHPGRQFELYEGRKCVATGVVTMVDGR